MGGERKRWAELAGLAAVLAIAAGLRLWRLEDNGYGTEYYAAAVRSMLQGFHLFFYDAFDPGGFLALDKPPLAFWIQAFFAWTLGFSGWAIHLPQALAGIASVALLYRLVRRAYGATAGLLAALLLALSPVAVAVDRSNNTDSWLVFFLLMAASATLRGRGLSLVVAMALLGVAFNVKMLAALICGPALLVGWWLASELDWRRRIGWMAAAAVVLVAVSLSWSAAFDLTPKQERPYVGSTTGNSMLELAVVHNGLERFSFVRSSRPGVAQALELPGFELYDDVPIGPLRLADPMLAGQFAWLLPLALLALFLVRHRDRDRGHANLVLWGLWALVYGAVFSVAGGIFHIYYLSALAPPFAALAAIGAWQLWLRGPAHLAVGLVLSAAWQAYLTGATLGWSTTWLGFPMVALAAGIAALSRNKRPPAAIGGIALLMLPAAWALSTIFSPGSLVLPSSSLPRWLGINDGRGPLLSRNFPPATNDPKLYAFLLTQRGTARFIVATPNTRLAAPIIIDTGEPVMAVGGDWGIDPILTTEAFAGMVARGDVRFVLVGRRRNGPLARWAMAHGQPVDDGQWRSLPADWRSPLTLYDLKPR
jgi:4-amino-4-deoxy-L-arabinose transferase-like glycosyltransferase